MALSADTPLSSRGLGNKYRYPVAASATIYQGSIVMIDSAGYARPAAASVTNAGCPGIAVAGQDNASGSAGALFVEVQEGEFLLGCTSVAQSCVGDIAYANSDNAVDETQSSNCPRAGIFRQYVSSTSAWVLMGPHLSNT